MHAIFPRLYETAGHGGERMNTAMVFQGYMSCMMMIWAVYNTWISHNRVYRWRHRFTCQKVHNIAVSIHFSIKIGQLRSPIMTQCVIKFSKSPARNVYKLLVPHLCIIIF